MAAPLQAAEAALQAQGITPTLNRFWALQPRTSSPGTLSEHALGRAVDINRFENPFIRNSNDIRVIRAVTGVDLGQPQAAVTMRQASQTFQTTFDQLWVDQQTQQLQQLRTLQNPSPATQQQIQQLEQLIQSIDARRASLDGYAALGFLNLEQPLIDALVDAGFSWGGAWQTVKDFMHFQL
jgi:hypothetical protein